MSNAYTSNNSNDVNKVIETLKINEQRYQEIRKETKSLVDKAKLLNDADDSNYIFLSFVMNHLPTGLVGLLIAIIFLASMGSTAAGLSSLANTTCVDVYRSLINREADDETYVKYSRIFTIAWGIFCMIVAYFAGKIGNLIEAVNILGSLFYGTILGIFIVAFYFKKLGANATFYAALIAEAIVCVVYYFDLTAFLWLNVIGCLGVVIIAYLITLLVNNKVIKQA